MQLRSPARSTTWLSCLVLALVPGLASGQEGPSQFVNKNGTRKAVTQVQSETTLIEAKTLTQVRGATGEAYYSFQLAPHETIAFQLESENSNMIVMRLATLKDPTLPPEARMQALAANESLKNAPRQSVTYQNVLAVPSLLVLHLKGHVNYFYKIRIQRSPGA